jgi:hypothetical protein
MEEKEKEMSRVEDEKKEEELRKKEADGTEDI